MFQFDSELNAFVERHRFASGVTLRTSITIACLLGGVLASAGCGQDAPARMALPTTASPAQTGAAGKDGAGGKSPAKGPATSGKGAVAAPRPPRTPSDRDAGADLELRPDGEDCSGDDECASSHCNSGLCCADGNCCLETKDCGAGSQGTGNVCEHSATCQGSRGKLSCSNFRCATQAGEPDDSKCDQDVKAKDCGVYKPVYCNGQAEQTPPSCPTACSSDDACENGAFCVDGACERQSPSPAPCTSDAMCSSGQKCNSGRCTAPPAAVPSASCLKLVGDDRCGQCACSRCERTATECWDSGDATRNAQCGAVLECALGAACIDITDCSAVSSAGAANAGAGGSGGAGGRSGAGGSATSADSFGCFGRGCYCGGGSELCTAPTGVCLTQIEAAAGGRTVRTPIATALTDPAFALHYAEQHAECLQRSCAAECGL